MFCKSLLRKIIFKKESKNSGWNCFLSFIDYQKSNEDNELIIRNNAEEEIRKTIIG